MPAESEKQQRFMALAMYYKKHGKLPPGMGKASADLREAARSMTLDQLTDYSHKPQKRRGTILTGKR